MKTLNIEIMTEIYKEFLLSDEEMIRVRGGSEEGDPIILPNPPPVRL